MNFKILFPAFLFLIVSINCQSQTDSLITRHKSSSDLLVSYNSSLIYPGIRAGIEFPVSTVSLTRSTKKGDSQSILKNRYLSAVSGWYHHPGFHDNLYFTVEWTMRRTCKNGFFTEFSYGAGYSRTFLGATTYQVEDNGIVKILRHAGYNYAMVIAGGGIGYNFAQNKKIPLSVFYKFDILTMFPYNSIVYFRPAMELGLIYKPSKFIQVFTKTRIVKK